MPVPCQPMFLALQQSRAAAQCWPMCSWGLMQSLASLKILLLFLQTESIQNTKCLQQVQSCSFPFPQCQPSWALTGHAEDAKSFLRVLLSVSSGWTGSLSFELILTKPNEAWIMVSWRLRANLLSSPSLITADCESALLCWEWQPELQWESSQCALKKGTGGKCQFMCPWGRRMELMGMGLRWQLSTILVKILTVRGSFGLCCLRQAWGLWVSDGAVSVHCRGWDRTAFKSPFQLKSFYDGFYSVQNPSCTRHMDRGTGKWGSIARYVKSMRSCSRIVVSGCCWWSAPGLLGWEVGNWAEIKAQPQVVPTWSYMCSLGWGIQIHLNAVTG